MNSEPGNWRFWGVLFEGGNDIGTGVPPWGGGFGFWSVSLPALDPAPDSITTSVQPSQLLDRQGVMGVIEDWTTPNARLLWICDQVVNPCRRCTCVSEQVPPTPHPSTQLNA